jgi:NADH:ubiquinone oxidoreductase subunit 2 (subunit N)
MSAPLFLLTMPLVLGLAAYFLRRWPQIAGPVAAVAAWLVAIILRGFELGPQASGATWDVVGQVLLLTEQSRQLLVIVYLFIGAIALLSTFYQQGDMFVTLTLASLSPLSAALMIAPFTYGAVLLLIAAGGLAMLIQGNRAGSTLAALRFLSLFALAMPLLLSAGWMIENDQFRFLDSVTLLLLGAVLLLTSTFPFQIWIAPVVGESSSLTTPVVYGIGQLVVVAYCLRLLLDQPFVYGSAQFQTIVSLSAAATLILASVLTITARSFGQQMGYLLLLSIGALTAVIGSGDANVVEVAMTVLILRTIGLIIAGAGLAMIRTRAVIVAGGANQFVANQGLAWRAPVGVGLFVIGCLSLAGLPLTPGFAGAWSAVAVVARHVPWLAVILVLSVAGGAFGVLRRLLPLLIRPEGVTHLEETSLESRQEQVAAAIILTAGAAITIFPRMIIAVSATLADLF